MSSSLHAYPGDDGPSEMDLDGEHENRKEVGEAGRTVVGGGVSQGAGWQSVLIRAPSPHPTSRTCVFSRLNKGTRERDEDELHIPVQFRVCGES
jgi:hypothetical protein